MPFFFVNSIFAKKTIALFLHYLIKSKRFRKGGEEEYYNYIVFACILVNVM